MSKCVGCGEAGAFSVVLAVGPQGTSQNTTDRYYIPNQSVREAMGTPMDPTETIPFCGTCIRRVEDAVRATILYIQAENGRVAVHPTEPAIAP